MKKLIKSIMFVLALGAFSLSILWKSIHSTGISLGGLI